MGTVWREFNDRTDGWGVAALSAGMLLTVPGHVAAQQSASAAAMIEEIVVVARRREEPLLDVPISIAAINAEAMQAAGIYNIDQVGEYVPNLTFATTDRRQVKAIYIRGIGNDSPGNLEPVGAALYLDGHYLPNTVGQMLSTVDIERIEVLRGPQGTLFGKNTMGGAVNIISAKPQPEFEADLLLRVADYGQRDFRAMLNAPLSSTVAGRFSVAKETTDGFYFNRTLNKAVGATDVDAFGAAIRITPNDNWILDFSLRANYQHDDNTGGQCRAFPTQDHVDNLANRHPDVLDAQVNDPALYADIVANHPAQVWTGPVYTDGLEQWGGSTRYPDGTRANIGGHLERLYPGATIDFWNDCTTDNQSGAFVTSQEKDSFLNLDNENLNTTIAWNSAGEVGAFDNANVKLIASRHETSFTYLQDRDLTSLSVDAIGTTPVGGPGNFRNTTSLELLLTADVSDRSKLILGVHYFDDDEVNGAGNCLSLTKANLAALSDPTSGIKIPCMAGGGTQFDRLGDRTVPGGPGISGKSGGSANESIGVFGHWSYDLGENWTLDLGGRWTDDDRYFNRVELDAVASTCSHTQPGDPPPTALCTPDYVLTFDSVFLDGFYNDVSASFSEFTPMASLARHFADGGMIYVQYAEGFLSGGFNDELNPILVPELTPLLTYSPEHVHNYELGYKGRLADGRLRLSTAIFYMDYTDKQEQINIDNSDGRFGGDPGIEIVTNAATVEIYGIELELRAQIWDRGFVALDLGYLENRYGEYKSFDPDAPGGTIDLSLLTIRDYSPTLTVNASIEHDFLLANGASLTPQLGLYYQTEYDYFRGIEGGPSSFCNQESYAKLRARVTYTPERGNWQASLFGTNVRDERYFDYCGGGQSGDINYRYGAPKTWGLEFNYRWGSR